MTQSKVIYCRRPGEGKSENDLLGRWDYSLRASLKRLSGQWALIEAMTAIQPPPLRFTAGYRQFWTASNQEIYFLYTRLCNAFGLGQFQLVTPRYVSKSLTRDQILASSPHVEDLGFPMD